jgi:CMP-N,N'-diacetyllegionaminic acid synthase
MANVLAIIPARGGSTGIPRKNLKMLGDRPLVAHAIAHGLQAETIDRVVVSSEDEEIRRVAASYGAEVIDRPDEFIHDNTIQEVDRLLHWSVLELERLGGVIDVVVLLYPTAPLRKVALIDQAVRMVTEGGYDSVLSLYEDTTYLWARHGDTAEPINYDPKTRGPRQKESWNQWAENKAIYVMTRDLLINTGCRLGGKIGCVEMSRLRSIDVDTPEDLELCRLLIDMELD